MNRKDKVLPKRWAISVGGAIAISILLSIFTDMSLPGAILAATLNGMTAFVGVCLLARRDARLAARGTP